MKANLIENTKITQAITVTGGAAGATDINGATLDMAGWGGVLMVVTFGAITASAVTGIRAQQGEASDLSDAADLEGSAQTVADNADEKTFYIDIKEPKERYVRLVVDRATQNAVVADALYIQYDPRSAPTSAQGTNVSGEKFTTPAEGTA